MSTNRGVIKGVNDLKHKVELATNLLQEISEREYSAKWDTRYINNLPNASFAVVEKGYSEGKDKRARHLPHHDSSVTSATENSSVDLPHYRNALARVNQIKSILGTESDAALRKKAATHLEKHRSVLNQGKASFNLVQACLWNECEVLFKKNVEPLLSDAIPKEE